MCSLKSGNSYNYSCPEFLGKPLTMKLGQGKQKNNSNEKERQKGGREERKKKKERKRERKKSYFLILHS